MNPPVVQTISECFIKPKYQVEEAKRPIYLSHWDLAMLSVHYIQKGLLFIKPPTPPLPNDQENPTQSLLEKLKDSLSLTLVHFYPLAGRLATLKQDNPHLYSVYIDCQNSPGAKFIYASVDLTVSDILSPVDVPVIVQSFFDHHRAVNHDGHSTSLLTIQVTELNDGIFIGCSINHMVVDGTSYWHFMDIWSNTFRAQGESLTISRPPIHTRWFPDQYGPVLNLPFSHPDQFISRFDAPPLRERIFHFSSESIAKLKAKANTECKTNEISSLQAVSALVWRCVTRARRFPYDQETGCRMAINNRTRMNPPLSQEYFGNCIQSVRGRAAAGELLENGFGWAAWRLHEEVAGHCDASVMEWVGNWVKDPFVYQIGQLFDTCSVMIGSSPRFEVFGNEFGMGKAVAVRSGYAHKFDGKVTMYPGYEGGGSMDLEVCLPPETMAGIESDGEFMDAVGG